MRVMASWWFSLGKLCVCVCVFSRCLHGDVAFNRQSKADISFYLHLSWIKSTFSIYSKPEKTSCGRIWIPFLHFSLFLWALAMDGCVCSKLCDTLVIKFGKLWWGLCRAYLISSLFHTVMVLGQYSEFLSWTSLFLWKFEVIYVPVPEFVIHGSWFLVWLLLLLCPVCPSHISVSSHQCVCVCLP